MKNIRKETVEREVFEGNNGFEYVRESKRHSLYEHRSGTAYDVNFINVNDPKQHPKYKETGGGATAKEEKIVTPDGQELESLHEVFKWLDENYSEFNQRHKDTEPVIKTRQEFGKGEVK